MKIKSNPFNTESNERIEEIKKADGKKYSVRKFRDRFFFPDEWMAFYDQLKEKQKITFNFLINTGARIKEVRGIRVEDVDFDRNNIVLRDVKRVINRPRLKNKEEGEKKAVGSSKIRILTISSQFSKFIKKIIREQKLSPTDKFPILSTPASNIAMKKALKRAGIKDWRMFSVHNVRKTLETWLLALGVDNFKIVKHFGHSINVALKHYVSPDIFSWEDKKMMREIIGDLFEK